jgi:site-specific recombinase XerD
MIEVIPMKQDLMYIVEDEMIAKLETFLDEEMSLNGFSAATKEIYKYCIRKFVEFCQKPPKLITSIDLKKYALYLGERKKSKATIRLNLSAVRFLYRDIWKRQTFA